MKRGSVSALIIAQFVMYSCAVIAAVGGVLTFWGHIWPLGVGVALYVISHVIYNALTNVVVITSLSELDKALKGPRMEDGEDG